MIIMMIIVTFIFSQIQTKQQHQRTLFHCFLLLLLSLLYLFFVFCYCLDIPAPYVSWFIGYFVLRIVFLEKKKKKKTTHTHTHKNGFYRKEQASWVRPFNRCHGNDHLHCRGSAMWDNLFNCANYSAVSRETRAAYFEFNRLQWKSALQVKIEIFLVI